MPTTALKKTARRIAGFTLIELMVTVAIVAILAAIALPSYTNQVRKSRRGDAKTALLDLAAREERYMTTNFAYSATGSDLGYATNFPISIPNATTPYYTINAPTVVAASGTTPASFVIKAVPSGDQANDSCKTFTLDYLGTQGLEGSTAVADCWK